MTEGLQNLHSVASLWGNTYSPVYAFLSLLARGVEKHRESMSRVLTFCFYPNYPEFIFLKWVFMTGIICHILSWICGTVTEAQCTHWSSQCLVLYCVKMHSASKIDTTFLNTHFQWQRWLPPNQSWLNLFLWCILMESI